MRLYNYYIIVLLTLTSCSSIKNKTTIAATQVDTPSTLSEEYIRAKSSVSYLNYQKAFNVFTEKMDPDPDFELQERFSDMDGWLDWIKNNLDKTDFKSYHEAEQLLDNLKKEQDIFFTENAGYIDAWMHASEEEQNEYSLFGND